MHEQSVPWTEGTLTYGGTEDSVRRQTGETNNSRLAGGYMRSKENPSRSCNMQNLLQNNLANLDQTWHTASLGDGN